MLETTSEITSIIDNSIQGKYSFKIAYPKTVVIGIDTIYVKAK